MVRSLRCIHVSLNFVILPTQVRIYPENLDLISFLFSFRTIALDDEKILLLDVGSCFNPFSKYDEFYAVGIDISPALEVSKQKEEEESGLVCLSDLIRVLSVQH